MRKVTSYYKVDLATISSQRKKLKNYKKQDYTLINLTFLYCFSLNSHDVAMFFANTAIIIQEQTISNLMQ